ncbi:MAG TPA: BON domain-containing protein [Rhodothermales bacterium]
MARRLYATFERELELTDIHGLQFYVRGGTVTIYGTIKNSLDVDLIVSLVRQVPGVKGVKTNLQVIDPWFLGEPSLNER